MPIGTKNRPLLFILISGFLLGKDFPVGNHQGSCGATFLISHYIACRNLLCWLNFWGNVWRGSDCRGFLEIIGCQLVYGVTDFQSSEGLGKILFTPPHLLLQYAYQVINPLRVYTLSVGPCCLQLQFTLSCANSVLFSQSKFEEVHSCF